MAEQASAPSPSFSGIDFNPAFFPSTASDYVEFPTAQGTVTFGQIFVTDIDTPTPSVDFDLLTSETGNINFGTSVPTTKTIKIGASTGTSIHCGSIDCTGTNINNAVSATTGVISLAPAQTTGILNIGSHPSTGTRTTGPINIGSNSIGVTPITIGTTGQSTIALNGTSVDVGTKLTTPKIDSLRTSGTIEIGNNQTDGIINIGTSNSRTTGAINIGTGMTSANTIKMGIAGFSTIKMQALSVDYTTKLTCPILDSLGTGLAMSLGANQLAGVLNIGGGVRTTAGQINIGTGSGANVNPIVIGGAGSTVSIGNTLAVTTSLKSPIIDCITDAGASNTSLSIGASATSGNIVIGATLGTGDVTIGGSQASGGTITLGSSNTVTTVPGNLTTSLPLTLPSSWSSPSSTQLGYVNNVTLPSGTGPYVIGTINTATQIHTLAIPLGTYIVTYTASYSVAANYSLGFTLGSPSLSAKTCNTVLTTAAAAANNNIKINMSCIIQNASTQQWYLAHQATVVGTATDVYLSYVRIL